MFIIVETIEDGEINLCVVPESWEKNGILYWPPGRKGMNLRKDESILPDINNWSKQKCTVKRKNFTTFQAALKAEKYLSRFDDTEDEENYLAQNSSKQAQHSQKINNIDFNNLVAEININNNIDVAKNVENNPGDNVQTFVQIQNSPKEVEATKEFTDAIIIQGDGFPTLPLNNSHNLLDAVEIKEKFDVINTNVENLKNVIHREISALHVKFDKLIDILIKNQNSLIEKSENNTLESQSKIHEKNVEEMKPLVTESDINYLERNLYNQEFELAFIKVMSKIGGTTGNKDGKKIVYILMDRLFNRQLLILCSWTGSTKKKKEKTKKIAFSKYNRITETIYKIIHLADVRYTIDDNINFLKRILKNSVTRSKQLEKQQNKQENEETDDNFECNDNYNENVEKETTTNTSEIVTVLSE